MFNLTEFLRTGHGWLGVLAVALLIHPVVRGWRSRASTATLPPGARWSVGLAMAFAVAAFSSGWLLYPEYRRDPKPMLLRLAPALASAFETKEHLAFYVLVLTLGGGGILLVGGAPRTGRAILAAAALLGLTVAILGATVGAFTPPAR